MDAIGKQQYTDRVQVQHKGHCDMHSRVYQPSHHNSCPPTDPISEPAAGQTEHNLLKMQQNPQVDQPTDPKAKSGLCVKNWKFGNFLAL